MDDLPKSSCIYYKLPEHLEHHHKMWVQARGVQATLSNTAEERKDITKILSDPKRRSHVLPALTFPSTAPKNNPITLKSFKGKEKASIVPNALSDQGSIHSHASGSTIHVQPAAGSSNAPLAGLEQKGGKLKKKSKRCAACRDHNCSKAESCPGRGNRTFCKCLDHPHPAKAT